MSTRREFLGSAARLGAGFVGANALARAVGAETISAAAAQRAPAPPLIGGTARMAAPSPSLVDVRHFYTRADLMPPRVRIWDAGGYELGGPGGGYVLLTPKGYIGAGPAQQGLMMLDGEGRLRWFVPTALAPFDLQCQQYKGKPVFTWWEGTVVNGHGSGEAVLMDMSLREIARIGTVGGYSPDLHELTLTTEGTALMSAYKTTPASLSSVGGPSKGYVLSSVAMEVDVASGKLLHAWDSLEHIGLSESYLPPSRGTEKAPFDYFHINSVSLADDGDLLISARNTWALYKVGRSDGAVKWRLNGKKSDFKMGAGAPFYWQHHARQQPGSRISVFDDGGAPAEEAQSRALILNVDQKAMTCSLERAFEHPARLLAPNQGSAQPLAGGGMFVGWGGQPYFSTFSGTGELLADGRLPNNVDSYRAFVSALSTAPTTSPDLMVMANPPGGHTVYVSWNGATEVTAWRVMAGSKPSNLATVATVGWSEFETQVTVNSAGPYFQVLALDGRDRVIGKSALAKV